MLEVSQLTFNHKEILELLVKKADIHEGKWMLAMSFHFSAVNAGRSPDEMFPSAVVSVSSIGLQKAQPDSPPGLVVDASVVNPASTKKKSASRS